MTRSTVTSTTGTAPITFTQRHDGTVLVALPDGSAQVYDAEALYAAVQAVTR